MKQFFIALLIVVCMVHVGYARDIGNVRGFGAETPKRVKVGENYEHLEIGMTEYKTIGFLGEPLTTKTSITTEGTISVNTYIGVEPCKRIKGWWVIEVKLFFEDNKLIRVEIRDL